MEINLMKSGELLGTWNRCKVKKYDPLQFLSRPLSLCIISAFNQGLLET